MDLVVAVGMAALLVGGFSFSRVGERGRVTRCAANLRVMGQAINSYANDHNDGIPPAWIDLRETKSSWDVELFPYLKPGAAWDKSELMLQCQPLFCCPSDPVKRKGRLRSYAMPRRDMTFPWPPSPEERTATGVCWINGTVAALGKDLEQKVRTCPEFLPELKRSVLPDPAGTLLVAEYMKEDNVLGADARVWGGSDQEQVFKQAPRLHFGKFNYLMADGQVVRLTKLQGGWGSESETFYAGASGIWTIKAGD